MKKVLSMVLLLAMAVAMLAGCGEEQATTETTAAPTPDINDYLVAEKVGTITGVDTVSADEAGIISHEDGGKKAVLSHEGLHNTGAIYEDVQIVSKFYKVAIKEPTDLDTPAAQNVYALIDGTGRTIAPAIYASFRTTGSDRYIVAITATERTFVDDENVVFKNYANGSVKSMFKGTWCVYDTTTGKLVPGVTGTTDSMAIDAFGGDFVSYKPADKYIKVDANGNPAPEDRDYFEDGSYAVEGKVGEMYDKYGKNIFNFDLTGFTPTDISEDGKYYIASKYLDGTTKYAVMDKTGAIISKEFSDYIDLEGDIVRCDKEIFNFEGKKLVEGEWYVTIDKVLGQYYFLSGSGDNEDEYKIIDLEGNVYASGVDDDNAGISMDDFAAYEKKDDDYYYYCFKDKGYTIKGYSFAPWVIKTDAANYRYDLVDTMSGETLLAGYKNYKFTMKNEYSYYVYAEYEGATDVFVIVANSKIAELRAKKESLLNDLTAAFNAAGINISINKETGEMAMDSTVLFGGDSAELTDAGKDFLNKFIKVYTEVAFSDKYAGFITKTLVEGHAAPVPGSTFANTLPLSEQRAANVKNYCLSADTGVNVAKIQNSMEAVGYGNSQPILNENGEANIEASRRVAFKFLVAVSFL